MSYFSKRTTVILLACTVIGLVIASIAILLPEQSVSFVYDFLSKKIYHREFSIEKWKNTLESFCLVPAFVVVAVNALLFLKYTNKAKIIVLSIILADIAFIIIYSLAVNYPAHVDSDLASELLLAKECLREKSLWPLGWYYATEIRALHFQLISTPLFLFISNWNTVKTLTSFFILLIFALLLWQYLNRLHIRSAWIKLLCCIFLIAPFSKLEWYTIAGENYYIPHIIMQFVYVGTFLSLTCSREGILKKPTSKTAIFFYVWAFLSGLSSIRYIINFLFPLCLTVVTLKCMDKENKAKITDIRGFWINDSLVFYATLGMIIGGLGYVFNATVLQALYTFSHWEKITFNAIGSFSVTSIIISIFKIFGYQDNVGVFSPLGVINMLLYIGLILFIVLYIRIFKHNIPKVQRVFLAFSAITFFCNCFVLFSTEYKSYHLLPVTINVIPALAIMLENQGFSVIKRWCLGVTWSVLLITSTFATIQYYMITDENTSRYAVIDWLDKSEYSFGYATFWNANVVTYLTNGRIEIAGQDKGREENGHLYINPEYDPDIWLCPKRYFDDSYHGDEKMFFLVTQDEYAVSSELPVFAAGKLVYQDAYYRVYEYENKVVFRKSF